MYEPVLALVPSTAIVFCVLYKNVCVIYFRSFFVGLRFLLGHGVRNNFVQSEVQPLNSELSSNAKIVQTLGVERVQL